MTDAARSGEVLRVGVLLADVGRLKVEALKFLTVHLNTLQHFVQYEFLPADRDDPFLRDLAPFRNVDRERCREQVPAFLGRARALVAADNARYALVEEAPRRLIVLSLARFHDEYYTMREGDVSVVALGHWKRVMAPPSLFEIILTVLLREAVSMLVPGLRSSVHIGTKGCLCDFTNSLNDVRYKTLQGFLCAYCREQLQAAHRGNVADELVAVLSKRWIGTTSEPNTPASIAAKLGYNLFITRGVSPTVWERARATFESEGVKQIVTFVGAVLLAFVLFKLGLKR